jgi:hypothetical protein
MDFALERARSMTPDSDDWDYLLEISWLYDRIVKSGSQIPVIDLAYELVLAEETAMVYSQASFQHANYATKQP